MVYRIEIGELLDDTWRDWFAPFEFAPHEAGHSILVGKVADQAELLGILNKLPALGLTLLSVNPAEPS